MENIQNNTAAFVPAVSTKELPRTEVNNSRAVQRISNYRLAVGWFMNVVWIVSLFALDWDAQWHINVGRDGFWTPPHIVFYSTVAICGVLCLGITLLETLLYYRRYPGVNDQTTTPCLFIFHGPLGFMLAGFGMLIMLCSAPLDDYWHRILGIDLEIWTPFHVMLLLGILIANLGMLYLFASEMNRRKAWTKPGPTNPLLATLRDLVRPATLGLAVAGMAMYTRLWFLFAETSFGITGKPGTLTLGSNKLSSYSLVLAGVPFLLVALVYATRLPGIATLTGLLLMVFRFFDIILVNLGIQWLAVGQGINLRSEVNDNLGIYIVYPAFTFAAGLLIDVVFLLTRRWRSTGGGWHTLLVEVGSSLGAGVLLFLIEKPWEAFNNTVTELLKTNSNPLVSTFLKNSMFYPAYWQALPLVIVISMLAGIVGLGLATSLRYTER